MGGPIVTIAKVIARYASVMVVDPWFVANEYFCYDSIDAVTTFFLDQISLEGGSNHLSCKYNFANLIEICLKETYCPWFLDKIIANYLL